ncbi:hypothetical protein ISCGN_003587 [Ixodes scapularis]
MSKGRSRKVAKPEDTLIGCDKCGRWAYVSESDFKNTQEPQNADFVCRMCKMLDEVDTTHRNKSEELKTTMTGIIKRWEGTNKAGAVDQNMIDALLDWVDKLEHCVEELVKRMSSSRTDKVALDTTMEDSPEYSARLDLTLAEPAKRYSNDDDGNPNPWITVLPRHFKNQSYDTVINKITDGLNLKETSHQKIGQAITLAAQFTPGERLETIFKVREGPNLIAAATYRPSAKSKLLRLTSINIDGVSRPTTTYLAMGRDQVLQWLLHLVRPWPPLGHLSLLSKMVRFILDLASKCERQHLHMPWKRLPLLAALSEWSADHCGSLRSSSTRVCQGKPAGVSSRRVW